MQRITVTKTETKTYDKKDGSGQGKFYILTDENGNEYTTFENALSDCATAVLDIDIKLNRGKVNVSKYVIITPATKEELEILPQQPPNDIDARFRMAALDCAIRVAETFQPNKYTSPIGNSHPNILKAADEYYDWLAKKTPELKDTSIKEQTIGELLTIMTMDAEDYGYTPGDMRDYINRTFGKPKSGALTMDEVKQVIRAIRESRIKENNKE